MAFTAKDVQALRQATGAGMMDAKKALEANDGDMEAAKQWLREKGLAASAKRDDRENTQGVVALVDRRQRRRDRQAEVRDRLRRRQRAVQGRGRRARQARRRQGRPTPWPSAPQRARRPEDHAQGEDRARRGRAHRGRRRQHRSTATCTSRAAAASTPCSSRWPAARRSSPTTSPCTSPSPARSTSAATTCPADVVDARAPDARDDQPQRGQARGGAAEDRRGPPQRLLQGRRPARPALRQGRQAVDHPAHRRRRRSSASPRSRSAERRLDDRHPDGSGSSSSHRVRRWPARPGPASTARRSTHTALRDHRASARPRRRRRRRRRRRQLLARPHRRDGGHGRHPVRPHRHARHGDERARAAGRARARRPADPRAVGDRDAAHRRAVHPPPGDAPPREGPRRHLRRRHRQPVLHHRHRGRAARRRDRGRRAAQGHPLRRRRRLQRRPAHRPDGDEVRRDRLHRRDDQGPQGDGRHGDRVLPRQRHPDRRVRHVGAGRAARDPRAASKVGTIVHDGTPERLDAHRPAQRSMRGRAGHASVRWRA